MKKPDMTSMNAYSATILNRDNGDDMVVYDDEDALDLLKDNTVISNVVFDKVHLDSLQLHATKFIGVTFNDCILSSCVFHGCYFNHVLFDNTNMRKVSMEDCYASYTRVFNAKIRNIRVTRLFMENFNIENTIINGRNRVLDSYFSGFDDTTYDYPFSSYTTFDNVINKIVVHNLRMKGTKMEYVYLYNRFVNHEYFRGGTIHSVVIGEYLP